MTNNSGYYQTQARIRILKNKVDNCRRELLELLEDWHFMLNILQPRLQFTYETLFGELEHELENKNKIIQELNRKAELINARVRKGKAIGEKSLYYINRIVETEFNRQERIERSSQVNFRFIRPDSEVSSIYRTLVKKLHPDRNGKTDAFERFWDGIQRAYRDGDWNRLKVYHQALCNDEINHRSPEDEERWLRNELRNIQLNLESEQTKLNKLKLQEPFSIEFSFNDDLWVDNKRKELKKQILQLDATIERRKRTIESLTQLGTAKSESYNINQISEFVGIY